MLAISTQQMQGRQWIRGVAPAYGIGVAVQGQSSVVQWKGAPAVHRAERSSTVGCSSVPTLG